MQKWLGDSKHTTIDLFEKLPLNHAGREQTNNSHGLIYFDALCDAAVLPFHAPCCLSTVPIPAASSFCLNCVAWRANRW